MVQIHIGDVDGLQTASIWKTEQKLKTLSRIERNLISAFPWMVGLVLFGIAAYSPSPDIGKASIAASAMLVLAPFLYIFRVSIKLIIHLTLTVCSLCAMYIASQTGGVMSVQLAWLLFAPLMPLRLISIQAGMAWMMVCLSIYVGMGLVGQSHWVAAMPQYSADFQAWTVLQRLLLCMGILALPWFYAKSYRHSIAVMRQHNKVIRQKKAELLRAQENKKKFISRLSHEMRTPMNAVVGFSHLLRLDSDKHPEATAVIEQIENTAQQLLGIINGIMDYTQLIDGKLKVNRERVRSEALIQNTFNMFAQRAKDLRLEYRCEIDPHFPAWIEVDATRTRQVLMNLLEHALQRTPSGKVCLRARFEQQQLQFTVEDSGSELSIEASQQLTQPGPIDQHEDLKAVGRANLMLYMANALTHLMGGTLQLQKSSQGVSIGMFLTHKPAQAEAYSASQAAEDKPLHLIIQALPLEVLVVDDNPVNRLLVDQVIRSHWPKSHVVQAHHGKQALTLLGHQQFDLVLMDMLMPEMDGIVATSVLRQTVSSQNQNIPVLGLTANISTDDHLRCLQAGMNDIVLKPFDRDKLTQRIAQLLLASPDFRSKYAQHMQAAG
jgi:signal transduction histidine kinase/AmiR/NasT family two-component response regulator